MKTMIITVGTGRNREDIAVALADSVTHHNPNFIWFVASEKTKAETVPLIIEKIDKEYKTDILTLSDEDDVQKCAEQICDLINLNNLDTENTIVDYTSGTKPMSAAAFYAAIATGIKNIVYMVGERDQTGRVIPGTQNPKRVRPLSLFADRIHKAAIKQFNLCNYDAAASLFKDELEISYLPERKIALENYIKLANAYYYWDRFDFKYASLLLQDIADNFIEKLTDSFLISKNKQAVYIENKEKYSVITLADLINNAKRCAENKRFDDAVARLYRAIEYMFQIFLFENHNIKTSDVEYNLLPEFLKKEFKLKHSENKKIQLGQRNACLLIKHLNPDCPLGKIFDGEAGRQFHRILSARNQSWLAHGFSPISEDSYSFLSERIINISIETWDNKFKSAIKNTTFPKLQQI